jgi:HSP20 family protein
MSEAAKKLPVKTEEQAPRPVAHRWEPFEGLRHEIERVFDHFGEGFWRRPFARPALDLQLPWTSRAGWDLAPAVDVAEKEKAYEITAELPGLSDSDIEVSLSNGTLTIKGEKKEEKEEKGKEYYLSERRYGAFQRSFQLPDGVDADKIEAAFRKGVLTVTLPKTAVAQASKKTISVKAA